MSSITVLRFVSSQRISTSKEKKKLKKKLIFLDDRYPGVSSVACLSCYGDYTYYKGVAQKSDKEGSKFKAFAEISEDSILRLAEGLIDEISILVDDDPFKGHANLQYLPIQKNVQLSQNAIVFLTKLQANSIYLIDENLEEEDFICTKKYRLGPNGKDLVELV
jgi:hypothetical protein